MEKSNPRLHIVGGKPVWEMADGRLLPLMGGGAGNVFITPKVIARLAYAQLYETAVMAQLVYRDYDADFNGSVGDTISVRKPAVFDVKEFTGTIIVQDAVQDSFDVKLDTHLDVSFAVTAKQLALQISAFNEELIVPAVNALREGIDRKILTLRDDIVNDVGQGAVDTPDNWKDPRVINQAGTILNAKNVPTTDRAVVAGPYTAGEWVNSTLLHYANRRGDTMGLKEASLGERLFGFDPYMSQNIDKSIVGTATGAGEESVAFHRTAFALVSRSLPPPQGTVNYDVYGADGFGLRVVQAYDVVHKTDTISLDILIGVKTLDPNRAVLISGHVT